MTPDEYYRNKMHPSHRGRVEACVSIINNEQR